MAADGLVFSSGGQLLNGGSQSPGQIQLPSQQPAAAPAAPKNTGGLLGAIYNHTIGPVVGAVGGGLSDIPNIAASAEYLPRIIAAGVTGNVAAQNKLDAAQNQRLGSTNFVKNFTSGQQNNVIGQNLEQGLGKGTGQVLDLTAPVTGAETLSGRAGLNAVGAGLGLGAKLGAVGGVANAAAQKGSGEQLFAGGVYGAGEGAVTGALGGALQAGLSSNLVRGLAGGAGRGIGTVAKGVGQGVMGRAANEAGAGADATLSEQGDAAASGQGGLFNKMATKAGTKSANNEMAQNAFDFSGAKPSEIAAQGGHDAQGNPVGMTEVRSFLRGNDMPDTAASMDVLSNTSGPILGGNLQDMTQGVTLNASGAGQAGLDIVDSKLRGTGNTSGVSGSYGDQATRIINDATAPLDKAGPNSTVPDVLTAISKLETAKSRAAAAVGSNDLAGYAVDAYQTAIDNLHSKLNSTSVNSAISSYKVSPELADTIKQDVAENGGTPQLAKNYIDTLDNAKTYRDIQAGMQHGVVAGNLSDLAKKTISNAVPKVDKSTGLPQVPSWYLARAATGDIPAGAAVLGRLAENSGIGGRMLAKVNPGAFNAGREAALAPDAVTAQKLANPGTGGAPAPAYTPSVAEGMGLPAGVQTYDSTNPAISARPGQEGAAPTPATPGVATPAEQTAQAPTTTPEEQGAPVAGPPPTTQVPVNQNPTGPTNLSFAPTDTTQPIPVTTPASNLDNTLQQIGVRGQAPINEGPDVNGISGPIPNSGATMGAQPGTAQAIPTTTPSPTLNASAETPIPVTNATPGATQPVPTQPMQTTNVPVAGSQASGEVPVTTPPPPMTAAENAAYALGNGARNVVDAAAALPGQAAGAVRAIPGIAKGNVGGILGAVTGEAANQSGQQNDVGFGLIGSGNAPTGLDTTGVSNLNSEVAAAGSTAPTLDPGSIPGGTLQDLQTELTNDPKNASIYEQIYADAQKEVAASAPPKLNATQAKNLTNIQTATNALNTYMTKLNSLGPLSRGVGTGPLAALMGKLNIGGQSTATANALSSDLEELAIQYATAINNGTKPQSAQIEQIKSLMPNIGDSTASANQKVQLLVTNLENNLSDATGASVTNRSGGTASQTLQALMGGAQ